MDDPVSELAAFRAVAETGALRRAAARLGVSTAHLAHAIRRLEQRIGARVIDRSAETVTITEHGRALLDRASSALADLERALRASEAEDGEPAGRLRIHTTPDIAEMLMPNVVVAFSLAFPLISVDVEAADDAPDVLYPGFDLAVRYNARIVRGLASKPIGAHQIRCVTAATPGLLRTLPPIAHPDDLLAAPAIRVRDAKGASAEWGYTQNGKEVQVSPPARLTVTRMQTALEAALAGVGLIYAYEDYLAPHLDTGRLVEVLRPWSQSNAGPLVFYAERPPLSRTVRAFLSFLDASQARERRTQLAST
ncbi:MAG: LysR family transcriptional regulator [Alphaproteobacteria bacterium]|nr:LysR family transcriptional regulator [Alphaproteobacteria bacterium]